MLHTIACGGGLQREGEKVVCRWFSIRTGEVTERFSDVVKRAVEDFKRYRYFNIVWVYNREGWDSDSYQRLEKSLMWRLFADI